MNLIFATPLDQEDRPEYQGRHLTTINELSNDERMDLWRAKYLLVCLSLRPESKNREVQS